MFKEHDYHFWNLFIESLNETNVTSSYTNDSNSNVVAFKLYKC